MSYNSPNNRVVVAQPRDHVWNFEHEWQHGLSACCSSPDCKTCAYAWFCPCCFVSVFINSSLKYSTSKHFF
jgi:hypothetical protein